MGFFSNVAKFGINLVGALTTTKLSEVVTAEMMSGVLGEVVGLLPVCIPTMISFIALRKGISFVQGILINA